MADRTHLGNWPIPYSQNNQAARQLEVDERVCQLRRVEEAEPSLQEKNVRGDPKVAREVAQLLRFVFSARRKTGCVDLGGCRNG